jgi:hypothetical protein
MMRDCREMLEEGGGGIGCWDWASDRWEALALGA